MKVNSINNTSFQSRNLQIRRTDDIMRFVNNKFPAISTSKIHCFDTFNNIKSIKTPDNILRAIKFNLARIKHHKSDVEYYQYLLSVVYKYKLANCAEMAELCKLVLGINGIKSYYAKLEPSHADHAILIIPNKDKKLDIKALKEIPLSKQKDFLVMDPWCGFVDTPGNAAVKYFSEHNKLVGHNLHKLDEISEECKYHNKLSLSVTPDLISKDTWNKLKMMYPMLVINK